MIRVSRVIALVGVIAALVPMPSIVHAKLDRDTLRQVREVLDEALAGRDMLARGRALAALVDMGDKSALKRAQEALAERDWAIRRYALQIMGERGDKAFFEPMLRSLADPVTRQSAFLIVGDLPPKVRKRVLLDAIRAEAGLRDEVLRRLVEASDPPSIALLKVAVRSKNDVVRKAVFATFAKLRGAAAVEFLIGLVKGRDKVAGERALAALLELRDDVRVKRFLRNMLKNKDQSIRLTAARALAEQGDREFALPVLRDALNSRDVEARIDAIEGIIALKDRSTAASLRATALNPKEDERVVEAALRALGASGDVSNLDTLRDALATDYIHMRIGAVKAMGELQRREAIPDLSAALFDGNTEIRRFAAEALGKVGGPEVVFRLQRSIDREVDATVRRTAIEAIGRAGDPKGIVVLQGLLVSDEPAVKAAAVESMLKIGDPSVVGTLQVAVDPRFPEVLSKAVKAICLLDTEAGIGVLKPNLNRVGLELLDELDREAGPNAIEFLKIFLEDGTTAQRALAIDRLLERGEAGVDVVRTLGVGNSDRGIRRQAFAALAAQHDAGRLDVFLDGLTSDDEAVRGICLEAVGIMGSRRHVELVKKHLDDRSAAVRVAAAHALYRLSKKRS